jgi:predicted TIM-barrel fold metal-dependent hydrolase
VTVVDFHTHLFPPGAMDDAAMAPLRARGLLHDLADLVCGDRTIEPVDLQQYFAEEGVSHSVVLAEVTPLTTGISSNEFVGEYCSGVEGLIPFCAPNPFLDRDLARCAEKLVARYGFRGFKIYPSYLPMAPNDSRLYPLYAFAQEAGLPVMFHTGISAFPGARLKWGSPLLLDDVAVDFPNLPLVLAHGGRDLWFDEAFALARIHDNVYLEVSGLPASRLLTYFPRLPALQGKVIFGTDFPVLPSISSNITAVRELGLPEEFVREMLGGTASRLLGLNAA